MKQKRLAILSLDAMVYEDLALVGDMASFKYLMSEGSRVNRVKTIYPSLTYPSHVSILTGAYPGEHGIINNEPSIPGDLSCDWFWFHQPVKRPDIHDAAKRAGLVTASVFWPVSGSHPSIDYLIAEYWAQGKADTLKAAYLRSGTTPALFDAVVQPYFEQFNSWESPVTDEAKIAGACDIVTRYKPHLLTVHLGQIDYYRHRYGVFNDKVSHGVIQSERFLGMLFDAYREAGIFEETNFVVLSDHGQINYERKMNLNKVLLDEKLFKVDGSGALTEWDAWVKTANFSAQVYINPKSGKRAHDRTHAVLKELASGSVGISRVYTAREARHEENLYGDFSFVLESDNKTLLFSKWSEPLFSGAENAAGYRRASHGHHPLTGPQPVFLAVGPGIKSGVVLESGKIVDEAPTFATLLGVDLPEASGEVIREILTAQA